MVRASAGAKMPPCGVGAVGGITSRSASASGAVPFTRRMRLTMARASGSRSRRRRNMGDSGTQSRRKMPRQAGSAATR